MKNTLLTLALFVTSLVSFSQIQVITTDSLSIGDSETASNYEFYYSDKYVMFGTEEEKTEDYTMLKFVSSRKKEIGKCTYEIYTTKTNGYVYISKPCNTIMILSDNKSFIFY